MCILTKFLSRVSQVLKHTMEQLASSFKPPTLLEHGFWLIERRTGLLKQEPLVTAGKHTCPDKKCIEPYWTLSHSLILLKTKHHLRNHGSVGIFHVIGTI